MNEPGSSSLFDQFPYSLHAGVGCDQAGESMESLWHSPTQAGWLFRGRPILITWQHCTPQCSGQWAGYLQRLSYASTALVSADTACMGTCMLQLGGSALHLGGGSGWARGHAWGRAGVAQLLIHCGDLGSQRRRQPAGHELRSCGVQGAAAQRGLQPGNLRDSPSLSGRSEVLWQNWDTEGCAAALAQQGAWPQALG